MNDDERLAFLIEERRQQDGKQLTLTDGRPFVFTEWMLGIWAGRAEAAARRGEPEQGRLT